MSAMPIYRTRCPIIVTRHTGAIAWLREENPALATCQVIESPTADDVRDREVVGNVPMHLAAVAHAVTAIEFEGAPPRGAEYGVEEMRAAGARLVRYVVRPAPVRTDAEVTLCPGRRLVAGRKIRSIIVDVAGTSRLFTGQSLPGLAVVVGTGGDRANGKWSYTSYRVRLAPGASGADLAPEMHSTLFGGCAGWSEAVEVLRRQVGRPDIDAVSAQATIRAGWPEAAERLDAVEADLATLES